MSLNDRVKWDRKWGDPLFHEGGGPSQWLLDHLYLLPPKSRHLDVACGDGRNLQPLLDLGVSLSALDISPTGIERAQRNLGDHARKVNWLVADLAEFFFPEAEFSGITCFNFFEPWLFDKFFRALKSGGILIYETYNRLILDRKPTFRHSAYPSIKN